MNNPYAPGGAYDMSRNTQQQDGQMYKPRESQIRTSSAGNFSRPNPPIAAFRERTPPDQRPPMSRPSPDQQRYAPQQRFARQDAPAPNGPYPSAANSQSPQTIPQYEDAPNALPRQDYTAAGPGTWSGQGYDPVAFPLPARSDSTVGQMPLSAPLQMIDPPTQGPPSALPPIPPGAQPQKPPLPNSRSRAPLGPPPSSRRGPSYYYPQYLQQAYVSPIVEESDSGRTSERGSYNRVSESRTSYASSNAIPIGVPDYYLNAKPGRQTIDSYASEYDESDVELTPRPHDAPRHESPPALLRQASLGKRSKPTLTTIKTVENGRPGPDHRRNLSDDSEFDRNPQRNTTISQLSSAPSLPPKSEARPPLRRIQNSAEFDTATRRAEAQTQVHREDPVHPDRASMETDDSGISVYKMKEYAKYNVREREAVVGADAGTQDAILNSLEKGGALPASQLKTIDTQTSLAKRLGPKRPARINVDAVREAEQRGSLTSLPDLIRRATKLASNLDRGRTASRLGFGWMGDGDEKHYPNGERKSGSLSDMISAFPPPAAAGTPISRSGSDKYAWPSHLRNESGKGAGDTRKQGRPRKRVCGMPVWVFLLLILLVVILIAAAVIVPVFLVVIPNQSKSSNSQAQAAASCASKLACTNGGVNILSSNGTCLCLCAAGHTGPSCSSSAGSACTTISTSYMTDATAGYSIPAVLSASLNFSIPLYPAQISSLLTSANSSCAAQNALVTFTALSRRDLSIDEIPGLADGPSPIIEMREATSTTSSASSAATSEGVVFAGDPPPTASGSLMNATSTQLSFAKVAVLFVLQDSGVLQEAQQAQEAFEQGFSAGSATVDLGNGYEADFGRLVVTLANGTTVGGRAS